MTLSSSELGQRFIDALLASDTAVSVETALHERPLLLRARLAVATLPLSTFIWRITHGGASRAPDEYRVQTTRPHDQPLLDAGGRQTLLLGYHEGLNVFAAWDVREHPNPGPSSSLQVSLELLEQAAREGFTSRSRETQSGRELVVAFRPDSAATYLEVVERLHDAGIQSATPAVEAATSGTAIPDTVLPAEEQRRLEIREIAVLVRDQRFRTWVLRAYDEHCAFCGLGLGIVEAAHIQGVAEGGPDEITNGIAACPNHHKAFDRGLLLVQSDGRITVNEDLASRLGIHPSDRERLQKELHDRLLLPADPAAHPNSARIDQHRLKWSDS